MFTLIAVILTAHLALVIAGLFVYLREFGREVSALGIALIIVAPALYFFVRGLIKHAKIIG